MQAHEQCNRSRGRGPGPVWWAGANDAAWRLPVAIPADAKAAAYIELEKDGETFWGVGIHPNTTRASFDAIIVGLSKLLEY